MEDFLKIPNENTASIMLGHSSFSSLLLSSKSPENSSEVFRLLFQLSNFSILSKLSQSDICLLLSQSHLQSQILDHLLRIEFPNQDYSQLISKLFEIFSSEDIRSSQLSNSILVQKLSSFICQDSQMSIFGSLLSSEDTVIKVRIMELIISLVNNGNFEVFDKHGLIDSGIRMITCGDLLLQIVAIEAIVELGNSKFGCNKLLQPDVQEVLVEALNEGSEPHFRNRLILMIGKIAHFTGNLTLVNEKYWKIVQKMIENNEHASVINALASLGFVSSVSSGLEQILENRNLLIAIKSTQKSSNQSIKAYFYLFFNRFLKLLSEEQTQLAINILQPYGPIVNELLNPFQDSHSDILNCICSFSEYKNQAILILSIDKFKEYLFKRPHHQTHEVSRLKFQIVENLNHHELPEDLRVKIEKYLKAGVFAVPNDEDVELESMN